MGEEIRNVWCGHNTIYNLVESQGGSGHVGVPVVASQVLAT